MLLYIYITKCISKNDLRRCKLEQATGNTASERAVDHERPNATHASISPRRKVILCSDSVDTNKEY